MKEQGLVGLWQNRKLLPGRGTVECRGPGVVLETCQEQSGEACWCVPMDLGGARPPRPPTHTHPESIWGICESGRNTFCVTFIS